MEEQKEQTQIKLRAFCAAFVQSLNLLSHTSISYVQNEQRLIRVWSFCASVSWVFPYDVTYDELLLCVCVCVCVQ